MTSCRRCIGRDRAWDARANHGPSFKTMGGAEARVLNWGMATLKSVFSTTNSTSQAGRVSGGQSGFPDRLPSTNVRWWTPDPEGDAILASTISQ